MKWTWRDTIAIAAITFVVSAFFFRLFWPVPQLIVTPDFGRSDSFDFSISTKFLLSQSLKSGTIPLWTPLIGDGFPIFAEGQIGTFFLPNLMLFRFFPFVPAYNTAIMLCVLTAGIGTFLWLRLMKFSRAIAAFAGITIALSGPVIPQLIHIALLQSFTLLPLIMALTYFIAFKPSIKKSLLIGFFVTQQILSGSPQGVFITQLFSIPYLIFLTWKQPRQAKAIIHYFIGMGIAVLLSAIQLIPSYEFSTQLAPDATKGAISSLPIIQIITLLNPFGLGNPQAGTYTAFSRYGSIFWENSLYIGIIPLFGIIAAFILPEKRTKRNLIFFGGSALLGLLLMTGRFGPFSILYTFWPFTLFHVPARFNWVFIPSLVLLGSMGIASVVEKIQHTGARIIVYALLFIVQSLMLTISWNQYHAIKPSSNVLQPPAIISRIPGTQRVYTIGATETYTKLFKSAGWQHLAPYEFLKNALIPNSNLFWNIPTHDATTGRTLRRSNLINTLLRGEIQLSEAGATVSAKGQKLFDLLHIGTIVSTVPVSDPSLTAEGILRELNLTVSLYKNVSTLPRVYFATPSATASTFISATSILFSDTFSVGHSVLLEQSIHSTFAAASGTAIISDAKDTRLTILVTDHPADSFLVLTDTYYPGWQATIDGNQTHIYAANISQRAVLVPKGNHTVIFSYTPKSFTMGAWISGISWFLFICITGLLVLRT